MTPNGGVPLVRREDQRADEKENVSTVEVSFLF